jgi:hypothetical protein
MDGLGEHEFQIIHAGKQKYTLRAQSAREKEGWLEAVNAQLVITRSKTVYYDSNLRRSVMSILRPKHTGDDGDFSKRAKSEVNDIDTIKRGLRKTSSFVKPTIRTDHLSLNRKDSSASLDALNADKSSRGSLSPLADYKSLTLQSQKSSLRPATSPRPTEDSESPSADLSRLRSELRKTGINLEPPGKGASSPNSDTSPKAAAQHKGILTRVSGWGGKLMEFARPFKSGLASLSQSTTRHLAKMKPVRLWKRHNRKSPNG